MAALEAVSVRPERPAGHGPEGPRQTRLFLLKLLLFVSIWGLLFFRGAWERYGFWVASWAALVAIGLVFPAPFRPVRRLAIRLGALLGRALAFLALAFIYYLVLTPVALAARLAGKRFLAGKDPTVASYWERRPSAPTDRASLERQF